MRNRPLLLLLLLLILVPLAGDLWLHHASDKEFREYLAVAQPGTKLSSIKARLGKQWCAITDPDDMLRRGNVKDRAYCEHKILYLFDVGGPSHLDDWVLEIYTDESDQIVGVARMTL